VQQVLFFKRGSIVKKNVGGADRVFRIALGLIVLSLYFFLPPAYRWWSLAGLVPLMTGLMGWCPAYLPFGIRTCDLRRG
jgi:hypothetical protein